MISKKPTAQEIPEDFGFYGNENTCGKSKQCFYFFFYFVLWAVIPCILNNQVPLQEDCSCDESLGQNECFAGQFCWLDRTCHSEKKIGTVSFH